MSIEVIHKKYGYIIVQRDCNNRITRIIGKFAKNQAPHSLKKENEALFMS